MKIAYLNCEFLTDISPVHLMQALANVVRKSLVSYYPIWLNNAGQQVIGLFPKMTLTVQPNITDDLPYLAIQQQFRAQPLTSVVARKGDSDQTAQLSGDMKTDMTADIKTVVKKLIDYQTQQAVASGSAELTEPQIESQTNSKYRDGFIGFINYDIAAAHLADTDASKDYLSAQQPLAFMGHYDIYLSYQDQQWQLHATTSEACDCLMEVQRWLANFVKTHFQPTSQPLGVTLQPVWSRTQYTKAFEQVQAYLKAGDCYQINLTQCWQGQLVDEALVDYLPKLYQATQAPFAGYVSVADYELLSCSPELFFTFVKHPQGEHSIITKPIKGTRPRGDTPVSDSALKQELADSDKDKAENVMIVDLLRNDLGKYAKTGTVQVPKLFAIESFSNVHHMVSTITATLKDDVHPLTVLFDSLPAGSITGTPKKRAVEIIHELEAKPRGAYCGTLGYLNFDGTGQWNVLIRTLQASAGQVDLWAGGGITIASACEAEYQECFDKVGNLLKILQA